MPETYQLGKKPKNKKRRRIISLIAIIIFIILCVIGALVARSLLKPNTTISRSRAVIKKVTYDSKTKHFAAPDFEIDVPVSWAEIARPPGPYQTYGWQDKARPTDGGNFTIYENVIPVNFAVNRVLIVSSSVDRVTINGSASDNCSAYTINQSVTPNHVGAPARWQNVNFLCDKSNLERDVIGTSSADGINTVLLKSPSTGLMHKFFFTYTNHATNPDYSPYYNAITSLRMQ